ncbi:uncharacterized protein BP01DRAFT_186981 [Aspergillus saccharolyticus JOP 1030-1]|uniref:Uncharacterized protein n=1 Tax=Aspergillus saccharolyticus JOP 1030-1 TaxID=1450539 RepID=A0A319A0M7_9EURO|nr:hypothetical protein BP01DRAFT_186981 [Aspergillus saccharolyticus JOP 1030-1]PYH41152.1 hypothetical protein BP01DRAFT_186981 [Aspergillus saccharolyticus JOP 1030-1]
MECEEADPTTQAEVDVLIFDYLLCTTINRLLCHGKAQAEGHRGDHQNMNWYLRTIDTMRRVLSESDNLTNDVRAKDRLLRFAVLFCCRYNLLQNGAAQATAPALIAHFLALHEGVGRNLTELKDAISAHLIMEAATEELGAAESQSTPRSEECIHHVQHALAKDTMAKGQQGYLRYFRPPRGLSLEMHLKNMSSILPAAQLAHAVIDYLVNMMKSLDPPILLQLERGKLDGLTREETRLLKARIGL